MLAYDRRPNGRFSGGLKEPILKNTTKTLTKAFKTALIAFLIN